MEPDYQEWLIKADKASRARFVASQRPDGGQGIDVHLESFVDGEPRRSVTCSLGSLEEIARRGERLKEKETLTYSPTMSLRKPDDVLELDDCTARYYARLTPKNEEQIVVDIQSKNRPHQEQGGQPSRLVKDLDNIQTYAEASQEYKQALSNATTWQPIIMVVEPGQDRDHAMARVVAQSTDRAEGMSPRIMSVEEGHLFAHKTEGLHVWPKPMGYVPVGAQFEITKTINPKIDSDIEFAHFHAERQSENYVIGRWAGPGDPPRPGEKREVAYGGKPREEASGKPLDYLVDFNGRSDGRGVPDDAPHVLIRKSEKYPFRGEVEAVCPTRDDAVASLREAVGRDRTMQRTQAQDWSRDLATPPRPKH